MNEAASRSASRLSHGLIPAAPVPFGASGDIDREAHESYVAWMLAQPIAGVAVWAHTGRGLHITREQRNTVLADWVDAARAGDRQAIIAGVGALPDDTLTTNARESRYLDDTLRMATYAIGGGADVLMIHPPTVHRNRPDQDARILAHTEALAELDVPLLLFYLYEAAGGITYSLALMRDLLGIPQVFGIKMATLDSVMTYQDVANMIFDEHPLSLLVTGEDRFLGYSMMLGARAALIGMASACTAAQAQLLQVWFSGHNTEFVQLSKLIDQFARVTFCEPMEGYIQRMLWCLVEAGVIPESAAHDPYGPELPKEERVLVRRWAHALDGAV